MLIERPDKVDDFVVPLQMAGGPSLRLFTWKRTNETFFNAVRRKGGLICVAVDPLTTAYRAISLPETPMPLDDLRLLVGLNPDQHYMRKKQVTVVGLRTFSGDFFRC